MTDIDSAAEAVAALNANPAIQTADNMAAAFEDAGARIANSLETAARRGELSFNAMAETVLNDLARLTVSELLEGPLNGLVDGLTRGLGERLGGGRGNMTINLNLSGASDADGFRRSEGQIAATLARAVSIGQTRI